MTILGRRWITFVLILGAVLSFVPMSTAVGQSLTTVTMLQTVSVPLTVTTTSTSESTATSPFTATHTQTSALSQRQTVYVRTVTLPTFATTFSCLYEKRNFPAKQGQVLNVSLASDIEISFYILHETDFQDWLKGDSCSVNNALVQSFLTTSFSTEFTVPRDGLYTFLWLNFASDKAAHITFDAKTIGAATTITTYGVTSLVIPSYFASTFTTTTAEISTAFRTEQIGLLSQNTLLVVVAILAIGIVIAVLGLRARTRRGK